MIYLFYGSDVHKVRTKAFAWVEASRQKAPEATYVRLSPEDTTLSTLEEISSTSGLFFTKLLVLLDDPFSLTASQEAILEMLPRLASSPNPIAILAPKITAAHAKKIEGQATKLFTFDVLEKKQSRGFNTALVNALGAKDGEILWKELQKAERLGDAPEMIHGLLHWKARDLMKKGSRVWTQKESRALSRALIDLVSEARGGDLPLSLALERFALSLSQSARP
ncbi:MAG: hypothetical protein WAV21_03785 [Minisyncoccia bacterium]